MSKKAAKISLAPHASRRPQAAPARIKERPLPPSYREPVDIGEPDDDSGDESAAMSDFVKPDSDYRE